MATPKSGELTYKQKKFCEYYIVSHNATESAIKAGYSRKTAYSQGQRLLKNVEVKKYIAELEGKAVSQAKQGAIASRQEILEFYTKIMRSDNESSKDRLKAANSLGEYYTRTAEQDNDQTPKVIELVVKDMSGGADNE